MIDLPVAPEERIYDAVIHRIENDTDIKRVVKSITSTPYPFVTPPLTKLPAIRIEAGDGTVNSATMTGDRTSLSIAFVLSIADGEHRDLMRLWNAVRKAIAVHDDSWLAMSLKNTGLIYESAVWRQPGITYRPNMDTKALESTAILEITYTIRETC